MNFYLPSSKSPYRINNVKSIDTPRLLVFHNRIDENIQRMKELLKGINPELSLKHLCPHVKTHKSLWTTNKLLQNGISFFKTTLHEIDMLCQSGAERIFLAYPLLPADAEKVSSLIRNYPRKNFYVQLSQPEHISILEHVADRHNFKWNYFIDVDVGMHRTGLNPEDAWSVFAAIKDKPAFQFAGLHAYDGHIHQHKHADRHAEAEQSMRQVEYIGKLFHEKGVQVPIIIVGGTPGFLHDAALLNQLNMNAKMLFSPGTWIYFDTVSAAMMSDTFTLAALVLTQVIDSPTPDTVTLNIGHKRLGADQGPVDVFNVPDMHVKSWSEEHMVVSVPASKKMAVGDYVMLAPKHICSTVNLWEYFTVIDANGQVEIEQCPVDARNR